MLPDNNELSRILLAEEMRDIPAENLAMHFPDFLLFKKLLEYFQLSTDILDNNQLDIHQIVAEGSLLLDALIPKILTDPSEETKQILNDIYDYLSEEDAPKKSDVIFVFGSPTPFRAIKAAELYNQQLSPVIIVSGGNPIYTSNHTDTEAARYKEILIGSDIPESAIITEDASITIPDNVRRSLNLLERRSSLPKSLTLVNSPYAQRRGWAIMKKHLPQDTAIYRVNSECSQQYKKENWFKQEQTTRIILNEFIKMRASVAYNTA